MTKTARIQGEDEGVGPLYHRLYSVTFPNNRSAALLAMSTLQAEMDSFSPHFIASFRKTVGRSDSLSVGDEFEVEINGPARAPVRVIEVSPHGFSMMTLKGHVEAGEIHFRVREVNPAEMCFEIESVARSKNSLTDFFYDKIPVVRFIQEHMWSDFCRHFSELVYRNCLIECSQHPVTVVTEKRDEDTGLWHKI